VSRKSVRVFSLNETERYEKRIPSATNRESGEEAIMNVANLRLSPLVRNRTASFSRSNSTHVRSLSSTPKHSLWYCALFAMLSNL
jgi:hypothetical protein